MPLRKFAHSTYWYFEGRDLTGKRYCVSTKQRNKTAAARAARSIELARAVPRLPKLALSQTLVALFKHKERRRVSEAEKEVVKTKGRHLIEHFGPAHDVHSIDAKAIDSYVDARRRDEVRPGKPISDGTIRMELRVLRAALREAKRRGEYQGDPDALRPTMLEPYKPRSRWLTHEQFEALCAELRKNKRSAHRVDYVLTWCHTGIRYGELHRLTAADLDRRGRRLFVRGRKGSHEHRERWVPLSDAAFEVLDRRARAAKSGPLFRPWLKPNVRLTLARACRRAGMDPVTPNDLRRSFVTWHLTAGTAERETQRYVGHSPRSSLVRRVYGQLADDAGRAAVASFPTAAAPPAAAEPAKVSQGVSRTA